MSKHYFVALLDADMLQHHTGLSRARKLLLTMLDLITSLGDSKIRFATLAKDMIDNLKLQVRSPESVDTPVLLLVKNGKLSDVQDAVSLIGHHQVDNRDALTSKMNELMTAAALLKSAEEQFLLAVVKAVYQELPQEADGRVVVSDENGEATLRRTLAEYPPLTRSPKAEEYTNRVVNYILKNSNSLAEGVFTGAI